jgi:fatty-acyl-CoA synthase
MNGPLYIGATIVVLPRWDRDAAAACIQRHRVTAWQTISTMMIDFLANPDLGHYDLSSLTGIRGGGAAIPEAICRKLKAVTTRLWRVGMSETLAATHINPPQRPSAVFGVLVFDVDSVSSIRHAEAGWTGNRRDHHPRAAGDAGLLAQSTGDASGLRRSRRQAPAHRRPRRVDEDGYYYGRPPGRMINASGYKVRLVEALMYHHPAIEEVCVIAARDARRGETVKALSCSSAASRAG